MEPNQPTREELLAEFESDERQCFDSGRVNNITDIALSIIAVIGSLVATILAAADMVPRWCLAAFAAIPAASASLQQIVDFRGRSIWYFSHSAKLTALFVALKYASHPDLEEFARKRAELEIEGDKTWRQIGNAKSLPVSRRGKRPSA